MAKTYKEKIYNYLSNDIGIDLGTANTLVYYYLFVNFDGPGTNSPTISPSPPTTYGVSTIAGGQVWINEVNPSTTDMFGDDISEFIELAGRAGKVVVLGQPGDERVV